MNEEKKQYLELLSEKYPTIQTVCREIINLNAILNLPKGTEHFMSDLHGEYEAFCHILNNCSGVIREKVNMLFQNRISQFEQKEICTLIYYPKEKLNLLKNAGKCNSEWYHLTLSQLIEIAKLLSSKYTRSKVRKAMPEEFAYIIDELLHVQRDEDDNQEVYHEKILETIIELNNADEFIVALTNLIKRLAVDHLHIVGDIFDRGACADKIMDMLMQHHSIDIQWGNHDILWMGAAAGSLACIANVVRNNIRYKNIEILENGYGISLRKLSLFATKLYPEKAVIDAALLEISIIMFKLEGQLIDRNPDYHMEDRKMLHRINFENGTILVKGREYQLNEKRFPTIDIHNPYELSKEEKEIMQEMESAFVNSNRLKQHVEFLYENGSMYKCFNGNLLFHGCVPLDDAGNLEGIKVGDKTYIGKSYLEYAEKIARRAYFNTKRSSDLDFMWYLWCGRKSPLSGRLVKTFERTFIEDESSWIEETDAYYKYYKTETTCNMILREFGLYSDHSHIINGHTPVKTMYGEKPVRADGKLLVIDGGFSRGFHKTTGIAGYTLIFNSHGMRIKAHEPFQNVYVALRENKDIESDSNFVETQKQRVMVQHTDAGKKILVDIENLKLLLNAYREGYITQKYIIKNRKEENK